MMTRIQGAHGGLIAGNHAPHQFAVVDRRHDRAAVSNARLQTIGRSWSAKGSARQGKAIHWEFNAFYRGISKNCVARKQQSL
jgi:hypothetical protein